MNSTRTPLIVTLLIALVLLILAVYFKNVAVLLLSGAAFIVGIGLLFKRYLNWCLPIVFSLIAIAAVEFALPYIYKTDSLTSIDPNSDYSNNYSRRIKGFGYGPRPGVHTSRKLTKDNKEIYNVVYSIGDDGYRKAGYDDTDADTYLYGGSFVFGEGLNDDETLGHFLHQNHGLDVKSIGIHGYGLQQALYNIQNGLVPENGTQILLTAPWHALRSACKPSYAKGTPRYVLLDDGYVQQNGVCPDSALLKVLNYSNIFKLVKAVTGNESKIEDNNMAVYLGIIKTIQKEARAKNNQLIIAYIKSTAQELQYTKWSNELIQQKLAELSDVLVDVTLSDTTETLDKQYYIHTLDKHPTALANEVRAKLTADQIN